MSPTLVQRGLSGTGTRATIARVSAALPGPPAASGSDFILSVSVTHAEVDNYARRLRERCDRTLADCRS
jgi:hypothetical protein